jgi:hypothetical protein
MQITSRASVPAASSRETRNRVTTSPPTGSGVAALQSTPASDMRTIAMPTGAISVTRLLGNKSRPHPISPV